MNVIQMSDFVDLLIDNYYGLGSTGESAVATALEELALGYFENNPDLNMTKEQIAVAIQCMAVVLYRDGRWTKTAGI